MVPHKPPTQCLHQPDQQSHIAWPHTGAQQHHQELLHTASSICQNYDGRISRPSANMQTSHEKCPMPTQTYSDRSQALTKSHCEHVRAVVHSVAESMLRNKCEGPHLAVGC